MDGIQEMFVKQFLLRVRQMGYTLAGNPPYTNGLGISMDIYRGKTQIATFDDRQLVSNWNLRITTDDSTREDIRGDYDKLHRAFIYLRDLFALYENAAPLTGYDHSLGLRAITEYNNWTLAVKSYSNTGELEFAAFFTGIKSIGFGNTTKTIYHNTYFDMDDYAAAKLDFAARSGLLPKEQLITPENIKYLHGSCGKTMAKEGHLFDEDTKAALNQVITDLEKVQDAFSEADRRVSAIPAKHARYIETKIFGTQGIFTSSLIDRETLPKGLCGYDIQYSRDKMEPERVWPKVLEHRFGTVITKKPLTMGEKGYTNLGEKDFSLNPEKCFALRDFTNRNKDAR